MQADANVRAMVAELAGPELSTVPVVAPALADAKVAIVTTAGLVRNGEARTWKLGDGTFTQLPADAHDLQLCHFSPNFDRSGFIDDINVVFPIDRLNELAADGVVASVAGLNLSFMGAQMDFATIINDSGPAAADILLEQGVDVVLLTPV